LGRWLEKASQACFIVTTREVLGIVGEEILAVPPLEREDAVELFMKRASAARQGYVPGADDVNAIGQLVKVLDCLPLAIELAAARVRVMAPRTLLGRMKDRFSVLLSTAGRRDRQATLRAAFDWSWELLSEAEKAASHACRFSRAASRSNPQAPWCAEDIDLHTLRRSILSNGWSTRALSVSSRTSDSTCWRACVNTPPSTFEARGGSKAAAPHAMPTRGLATGGISRQSRRRLQSPILASTSPT
jgi:hypothetical protein